MNRDQALEKIKKCMALSKSANEHEASAAVRQAQALMRQHGISDAEIELADVGETRTRARSADHNRWEVSLAACVAGAFGCEWFSISSVQLVGRGLARKRDVCFVGMNPSHQVAAYAYDVLQRQLVRARAAHIAAQPRNCKATTKTARGDRFATGWVYAVSDLVERFAGSERERLLIEQYISTKHPGLESVKSKDKSVGRNVRDLDLEAGFAAGKHAELKRGLGADSRPELLGR